MKKFKKWLCKQCPLHGKCSPQSWDEAEVVSWDSEDDCRNRLLAHILQSDTHQIDRNSWLEHQLHQIVARCEVTLEVHEFSQEEMDRWKAEHDDCDRKRRRRESTPPAGGGAAASSSGFGGPPQEPPPSSCTSSTICGIPKSDPDAKVIQISVAELMAIREGVARCHKTYQECIHLMTQGSSLFDSETANFAKATEAMGLKLGQAGMC